MRAIILAAGVGERLRPFTDTSPKCLVEIGGRSLLFRHLDHFARLSGITQVGIVVGYRSDQIRAAVARWQAETGHDLPIAFADNPRFREGSILSLYAAREWLEAEDTLVMDADVLYDSQLLSRLISAPYACCFLMDETAIRTGEEMMLCATKRRVLHIARSRESSTQSGWDVTGEGVGFFKLAAAEARALIAQIEAVLATGRSDAEYEVALDRFVKDHVCSFEHVSDLAWTEIDFPEDVTRAARDVLPLIEPIDAHRRS